MTPLQYAEYFVLATGVIGNLFVSHKKIGGFYFWILSNIVGIPVMWYSGLEKLTWLYVFYACITAYSIYQWKKIDVAEKQMLEKI